VTTIRPLIITQGNRVSGQIIPTHGPSMRIKSVDDFIVTLAEPHCLLVGERIHLLGESECGQIYQGVFRVKATAAVDSFELEDVGCSGPMPDKIIGGLVGRAMILDGFSVEGSIRTSRAGVAALPGLTGCVKVGASQVKLMPGVDVSIGDRLVFPAAGLADSIVTGVFEKPKPATTGGGNCGCPTSAAPLGAAMAKTTFVSVDKPATLTVPCDSPEPVFLEGRELARFTTEINTCGQITYEISNDFKDFQFPGGGCGSEPISIGCYELTLVAGSSWRAVLAAGEVFLKPSMVR